jgi:hypothetical protein
VEKLCAIPGCKNKVMSSGHNKYEIKLYKKLCTRHHKKRYKMPYHPRERKKHQQDVLGVSELPCAICGWHESYCDRHRIIYGKDGGGYTKENVIPLCPNCHRLEHVGKVR